MILLVVMLFPILCSCGVPNSANRLNILVSHENEDLEYILTDYASSHHLNLNINYQGTLDIVSTLNNQPTDYDAVWLSNSIWMYMLKNVTPKDSKSIYINPIVFGIKKSKAEDLGLTNRTIYLKDIITSVESKKLSFLMPSVTQTDSGASAYLGFLSCLANTEVLDKEALEKTDVKESLTQLFSGVERSSGSDDYMNNLFINGDYDALVNYESSLIWLNKRLEEMGEQPLYLIYPYDGVSLADAPMAYIGNGEKEEQFKQLQKHLLSAETQKILTQNGRRAGYGGLILNADQEIFNRSWGIDTTKYLSPIKYPSTDVIESAFTLYQTEIRKKSSIVFCLDFSGSMAQSGINELQSAMDYILTDKSAADYLQFTKDDQIIVIPFNSFVMDSFGTNEDYDLDDLLDKIVNIRASGGTNIYDPAIKGLELLKNIDPREYTRSIVLMTDGASNNGSFDYLEEAYLQIGQDIPIFAITFGEADTRQLDSIAELTSGMVFDGREDLVGAFKSVRGYN